MPDHRGDVEAGEIIARLAGARASRSCDPRDAERAVAESWGEIDTTLLEETRVAVPSFPLDLLPPFWRGWVADTARATSAPVDYVAQSLLAAVAGLCGAGAAVRLGPRWSEPLVLWQALVGSPSSGKSPAMAPLRELLATLELEPSGDGERPAIVLTESSLLAAADAVEANPRGVILWRDAPVEWLLRPADSQRAAWLQAWSAGPVSLGAGARRLPRLPVSLLVALPPDRAAEMLVASEALAARFLFVWPMPVPYRPLSGAAPAHDGEALAALRRILRKARRPEDPLELIVDAQGLTALDTFLSGLQDELREAEGLEAAWLGKGRGTVARLAGVLELLAWSESGAPGAPGHLGTQQIERAVRLWSNYFRPQARALFHRAVPSLGERQARRVARWLRDTRATEVSREEVRREALSRSVNAAGTDLILQRLEVAGIVAQLVYPEPPRGRPPNRWLVNPHLTTRVSGGNAGNAGKESLGTRSSLGPRRAR